MSSEQEQYSINMNKDPVPPLTSAELFLLLPKQILSVSVSVIRGIGSVMEAMIDSVLITASLTVISYVPGPNEPNTPIA